MANKTRNANRKKQLKNKRKSRRQNQKKVKCVMCEKTTCKKSSLVRLERTNYDGNPISLRELQLWKKKTPAYTTFDRVTLTSQVALFNVDEIEISM